MSRLERLVRARRAHHHNRGHRIRYRLFEELAALLGLDTLYDSRHQ